jgi:serine/threonine protein kinase
MSHAATSQFFDGLRASQLLDDARVTELAGRPEAAWGDIVSLGNYARDQGWLTDYQLRELREGRGHRLAVGPYRIFDQVEDGPGGPTFKALHPAIQQPVAIKVLHPDWLGPADTAPAYVARLQSASLVQSPHLATVLDAGVVDDSPFVVQELVDGCDLYHLVNEMGALPVGLACEYARQAALALKAAHERGIVHGDVSPHALLLTPVKRAAGANGDMTVRPRPGARVKLAGLSHTPLRPPIGDLPFGQPERLGAVAFVAPERLTSSERSPAWDLFGLGASLYYLLTTRPPHAGETPVEVLLHCQQGEPTPLETLRSDVPAPVLELVRRLLSRDPAARPRAADAVEAIQPHCEPSAIAEEPAVSGTIPLAAGTDTQPGVPTAKPAAEPGPALQPTVEPLPEFHPLSESSDPGTSSGSGLKFSSGAFGTDSSTAVRPRARPAKKSLGWLVAGVVLHLTAILLLVGFLTNWFAFLRAPASGGPTSVEEKKDGPPQK